MHSARFGLLHSNNLLQWHTRQLGVACHGMKPAVLAAVHPLAPLSFPSSSLSTQFGCQKHVKGVVIVVVVIVIGLQ